MGISTPRPFASGQKAHELNLGLAGAWHQAAGTRFFGWPDFQQDAAR